MSTSPFTQRTRDAARRMRDLLKVYAEMTGSTPGVKVEDDGTTLTVVLLPPEAAKAELDEFEQWERKQQRGAA
ncbi:MAG: hypothetical protein AAGK02_16050 [Pseudomonadota bacterium]